MALRNPEGDPIGEDEVEMVARVAAVDVAKATGMVCTRVPHPTIPGRRVTKVWEVEATTNSLDCGQLLGQSSLVIVTPPPPGCRRRRP